MLRLLVSTALLTVLAGSAVAADLPSTKAAPSFMAPVSAFNWTGFYVGAITGVDISPIGGDGFATSRTFAPIGGVVGYNYQLRGPLVIGVEADAGGLLGGGNTTAKIAAPFSSVSNNSTYFSDVRARLGYAADRALFYVAAGVGFGDQKTTYHETTGVVGSFRANYFAPLSLGAGVDYAITPNWIARVEYRFDDGKPVTYRFSPTWTDTVSVDSHLITLGLIYKFGNPAPIVAKY